MNLGASSGQINTNPVDTTVAAEDIIHALGAIGIGMVALFMFLICRELVFSIPTLSLV